MKSMKKLLFLFISFALAQFSNGQDITTLTKLHEVSEKLGVSSNLSIDTMLIRAGYERVNRRITEQQQTLLKAAECYLNNDFENSFYYIQRVELVFRNNDLNNLKYVVQIGTYAHLNEAKLAAKFYYIANRSNTLLPQNLSIILKTIKDNLPEKAFEKGLARYYYYHQRMYILASIYH
jgi:hypothetical protein